MSTTSLVHSRLPRGRFWRLALLLWLVFYAAWNLLGPLLGSAAVWLINVPVLLVLLSLCVARLHDRGRSGWWLLAVLLPVLGALWLLWQLALRAGQPDDNRWGHDPLQHRGDYLTVR